MIRIERNSTFNTNENISSTGSTLDYRNGYFLNYEVGRGDLTSQFNVSEFLSNPSNAILADNFLQYIKNTFTTQQISDIKNDNQKLSDAFNFFYNKIIRGIDLSNLGSLFDPIVSSTTINYLPNLYFPNGNQDLQTKQASTYSNSADSYYINIVLFENQEILSSLPYELEATINDGFQVEKDVVYLNNAILSGTVVNERIVKLNPATRQLIQGFVDLNFDDSPFSYYSNSGLDFVVSTFSGKTVYLIDAEIYGNVSSSESIFPVGENDVLIGDNITFTFKTVDPLKSIDAVYVDNVKVNYDRLDNLSKSFAGKYTFSSVTKNHSISVNFV